jgi:hypothetical protein
MRAARLGQGACGARLKRFIKPHAGELAQPSHGLRRIGDEFVEGHCRPILSRQLLQVVQRNLIGPLPLPRRYHTLAPGANRINRDRLQTTPKLLSICRTYGIAANHRVGNISPCSASVSTPPALMSWAALFPVSRSG